MPRYHAVILDTEKGKFQIHLGQPGRPRVYRQLGRTVVRVKDEATLIHVSEAFADKMRAKKEGWRRREQELARRRKWWVRASRWVGAITARWAFMAESHGP